DRFSWLHDDEFAHQAHAGVNPVSIEKLKVFLPENSTKKSDRMQQDSKRTKQESKQASSSKLSKLSKLASKKGVA
ncbi:linoleate 13S-lipoxygenase 3-1, chloroplastic, partial [Tanacetum coccineum]